MPGVKRSGPASGAVMHFKADWLPVSEVFVYDLVRHLERPSVVVGYNALENTERFPLDDVHSLCSLDRYVHPVKLRPAALTAALEVLARKRNVELVHAHHGYRVEVLANFVQRRRIPLVLSLHGHDVTGYLEHHADPYREVADFVSAVVVPSRFLVDLAVEAGFDREIVTVLPSGVDTTHFAPSPLPSGPPVALFVGRFVEKKGLDTLANAWPRVQARLPEARLRILGYGRLEALARSIRGNVSVENSPDRWAVRDAMKESTVIVSPSHTAPDDSIESLLVVNLEAQASGRPVITTCHGGIPEYVREGETALLVTENDPEALAEALVKVMADEELASRLGAAGPRWASYFDVRATASRMDSLYDELLRSRAFAPSRFTATSRSS